MTALVVRACGPATGLQDAGRFGWQRYGVSNSGAMDRLAAAAANDIAGCRSTAQEMRRAGVAMPPALIALAALELEYHLKTQPR